MEAHSIHYSCVPHHLNHIVLRQWLIDDQFHFAYVSRNGKYQGLISPVLSILEFFEEFRIMYTHLQDRDRYCRISTSANKLKVNRAKLLGVSVLNL